MKVAVLITGQLRDYKINYTNHLQHLILPNSADVFVYACTKNTIHSCGNSLNQKYYMTNEYSPEEIRESAKVIYGPNLKGLNVQAKEDLPEDNFGTLGYFRTRMQNQIDNIGHGFKMALEYSKQSGFEYDIFVRCRPDNSMFPWLLDLSLLEYPDNAIYSTVFSSGHRDLCFFAAAPKSTFEKYCSFKYLEGEDQNRTDSNFACTEHMWQDYLNSIGVEVRYITDVCKPFTGFDKTLPVTDFPYRNKKELLVNTQGNLTRQVEPE